MSRKRKLPHCAHCGISLSHRARMLIEYTDLPGNPEIGWCYKCAGVDPCFAELLPPGGDPDHPTRNVVDVLRDIENRGQGRLMVDPRKKGGAIKHDRRAQISD